MSQKNDIVPVIPEEILMSKIFYIRGQKVMLDKDLAELYEVQTKVLNQAVKRNINRFPEAFMFQLSKNEFESLRSQIVTLNARGTHPKYLPYVFTEHGVCMLSTVLNSEKAVQISIFIINAFIKMREILASNVDLKKQIEKIESKLLNVDEEIQTIFNVIKELISVPKRPKKEIGFHTHMK